MLLISAIQLNSEACQFINDLLIIILKTDILSTQFFSQDSNQSVSTAHLYHSFTMNNMWTGLQIFQQIYCAFPQLESTLILPWDNVFGVGCQRVRIDKMCKFVAVQLQNVERLLLYHNQIRIYHRQQQLMRRVVVTGLGAVSPLGNNLSATWAAIMEQKSGIRQYLNDPILKNDKPYNLALVKDFQFSKWKMAHASSRLTSFLAMATNEAIENSAIDLQQIDLARSAICLGNLSSSVTKLLQQIEESAGSDYKTINRLSMLQVLTNIPAATLNVMYKFQGPSLTVSTACASGLSAIVEGYKWIKLNQADFVIVGASEDVYNPLYLNSSIRLQAMTTKLYDRPEYSSRPFDKNRSGFVLGQGSGILILQSLEHALKRNAPIKAEVLGYGHTSDGFHLVRPESSGNGQLRSMKQALEMSNIRPQDIDHINVHATSTLAGDQIQAKSIQSLLGKYSKKPSITALKSYFGHTFAAAGALQTIVGICSLQRSICPRIMNLEQADVDLNYACDHMKQEMSIMMKNSFGFGGINVSCIFKKY